MHFYTKLTPAKCIDLQPPPRSLRYSSSCAIFFVFFAFFYKSHSLQHTSTNVFYINKKKDKNTYRE